MALLMDSVFPLSHRPLYSPRYGFNSPMDSFFAPFSNSLINSVPTSRLFDEFFGKPFESFPFFDNNSDNNNDNYDSDVEMDDEGDSYDEELAQQTPKLSASAPAILPPQASTPKAASPEKGVDTTKEAEEPNTEYIKLTESGAVSRSPNPACAAVSTEEARANDSKLAAAATTSTNVVAAPSNASPNTAVSIWNRNRSINLTSNDTHTIVKADFSGIPQENIEVRLHNGYLTLKAKNDIEKRNKSGNVIRRQSETISRSYYVGNQVDPNSIQATYNNGDFELSFPKLAKTSNNTSN